MKDREKEIINCQFSIINEKQEGGVEEIYDFRFTIAEFQLKQ